MGKFKSVKQKLRVFCLLFFVFAYCFTSFSYEGWYRDGNKMTYVTSDGYRIANAWRESDGMKFFLDENGYVVYNKVFNFNGNIFYVGVNGARVTNQFVDVTQDLILGEDVTPGRFYFDDEGKAYRKIGNTFLKTINGKKYAFDEDGHIYFDCWLNKDGEYLDHASDIFHEGRYLIKEDGTVTQNEWYNFSYDVGVDNGLGESELIAERYGELEGLWMYFDNKCEKIYAGAGALSKKLSLNGLEYSFDENGVMFMGFQKNRTPIDTHQASNPTLKDRIKYYDKYSGALLKNRWVYDVTPEAFDYDSHEDGKEYWYYVDGDGSIVKNRIKIINGRKYSFDGLGRLRKGFLLIDGVAYMGAEYKGEDLCRDDFMYSVAEGSHLYGSDLLDLHYFKEMEGDDEGAMMTGDIHIELSDGVYEFNFRDSGVAYGNKNELKLFKSSYYKNGLKFKPWEDTKYGIVKVKDDEYKLINSKGKIVTGKRKLIKDDYDNYIVLFNDKVAAYIVPPNYKMKLKWKTFNNVTGYYYYNEDSDPKGYSGLAVASGTQYPTPAQIVDIPNDMKVNFR